MEKISLITGGTGGIGLAAARIIGRDHFIVLCARNQDRLENAISELKLLNISCMGISCDISNREDVDDLLEKVSKMGEIASLIHTAGVSPHMGDAESIMRINALGTIYLSEAFFKVATEGSCLINISSTGGHYIPNFVRPKLLYKYAFTNEELFYKRIMGLINLVPRILRAGISYAISKNFVSWYSRKNANRFAEKDARVISISPGTFNTKMGQLEEGGSEGILKYSALKRLGRPEEIAELIAFCASEKSSYTTGVDIPCDGGSTAAFSFKAIMETVNRYCSN